MTKPILEKFNLSELEKEKFEVRTVRNPSLKNFLRKNKTTAFLNQLDKLKVDKRNLLAEFIGKTGTGKSYSSIALALRNDPEFSADKIFFTQRELIEKTGELYKNKPITLINDEQVRNFGVGTYRIMSQYNDFLETIRKKQISVIRNSPTRKTNVSMNLSHFLIETFEGFIKLKDGILRAALCDANSHCFGYVEFSNPEVTAPKLIKAYEKQKDVFLAKSLGEGNESIFMRDADRLLISSEFIEFAENNKKLSRSDLFNFVDFMRPELNRGNEAVQILEAFIFKIKMSKYVTKLYHANRD